MGKVEDWDKYSQPEISKAARLWYGNSSLDSCCLAENRLAKGEPMPTATHNKIKDSRK